VTFRRGSVTGSLPSLAWQVEPALAAVISERYGSPETVS
jgi:hypothetical protein